MVSVCISLSWVSAVLGDSNQGIITRKRSSLRRLLILFVLLLYLRPLFIDLVRTIATVIAHYYRLLVTYSQA